MQEQATRLAKGPVQAEQSSDVTQGWVVGGTGFSGVLSFVVRIAYVHFAVHVSSSGLQGCVRCIFGCTENGPRE
jgi:hypothetical protein